MSALDAAALRAFETDGYVVVRGHFADDELSRLRCAIEDFIAHLLELEGLPVPKDPAHEGFELLDAHRRAHPERPDRIHELYNLVRRSEALNRLVYGRGLEDTVKPLIGLRDDQMTYVRTQFCRMDSPRNESHLLKWHQESFITLPDTRSAQLWAPVFGPSGPEHGSIQVLRGSAADGEVPHFIEPVSDVYVTHGVPDAELRCRERYQLVIAELEPGDALFFHPHLLHRSHSNPGDRVRYTAVAHYLNPRDPGFRIVDDAELIRYHQGRCANADQYAAFIAAPKDSTQ